MNTVADAQECETNHKIHEGKFEIALKQIEKLQSLLPEAYK
jgi:hypothetical protein